MYSILYNNFFEFFRFVTRYVLWQGRKVSDMHATSFQIAKHCIGVTGI